jgi:hypothetical protein
MKRQSKGMSFAEEEELSSVLSELLSEILPDIILRVVAEWNQRPRLYLLIEGDTWSKALTCGGF